MVFSTQIHHLMIATQVLNANPTWFTHTVKSLKKNSICLAYIKTFTQPINECVSTFEHQHIANKHLVYVIPRGWFLHKMRSRLYWKYIGRLIIDIEPWKVLKNIMNENILKIQTTQEYYIEKIFKTSHNAIWLNFNEKPLNDCNIWHLCFFLLNLQLHTTLPSSHQTCHWTCTWENVHIECIAKIKHMSNEIFKFKDQKNIQLMDQICTLNNDLNFKRKMDGSNEPWCKFIK